MVLRFQTARKSIERFIAEIMRRKQDRLMSVLPFSMREM